MLSELDAIRAELEERKAQQEEALSKAEAARADAEAAIADLEAGVSQQTEFVMQVMARGDLDLADLDAAAREREERLAARLREMQEAEEYAAALDKLAEAERRAQEAAQAEAEAAAATGGSGGGSSSGGWVCPVRGELSFTDTWGAARSGGRSHQGTDIMAASGTPTVAPVSGRVEHRSSSLGGYSWYVYGDDGDTYYGAHLSGYENQGAGWVAQGTVIGYVGSSGNASTPHLHYEWQPDGGSAVNPYSRLLEVC